MSAFWHLVGDPGGESWHDACGVEERLSVCVEHAPDRAPVNELRVR